MLAVPTWKLSDVSRVKGPPVVSAYEVSMHLSRCRGSTARQPGLLGACYWWGALNFSDAQIKRSDHVG
jgi:hypothetical protein